MPTPTDAPRLISGLLCSAMLLACSPDPATTTEPPHCGGEGDCIASSTSSSTSTDATMTTWPPDTCGCSPPSVSCSCDPTITTGCSLLGCDTTMGDPPPTCDVFAQDCPDGEKCAAINGGGSTACVPVGGAGQPGDSCVAENADAGLDDCAKGVMCWVVVDGIGTCVKLCEGTPETPICPDRSVCEITSDGALNLCLPMCSPLLQDCAEGNGCYLVDGSFLCVPDASGDTGVASDPCEFINVCEAGLMCAEAAFVGAGCPQGSAKCCTPFCDLNDPIPCPNADQSCVPFFTDPMSLPIDPPDAADIGVCGLPG